MESGVVARLQEQLRPLGVAASARVALYEQSVSTGVYRGLAVGGEPIVVDKTHWQFGLVARQIDGSRMFAPDLSQDSEDAATDTIFRARVTSGTPRSAAVSLEFAFSDWSELVHVHMPAAIYAGNRFRARQTSYSPIPDTFELHPPMTISDVPRLSDESGESRVQLRSGDMAFPAAAFYFPERGQALLVLTSEQTAKGWIGFDLEESEDRSSAALRIMTPAMRERVRYTICNLNVPCEDRAADWDPGDEITMNISVVTARCDSVLDLYRLLFEHRERVLRAGPVEDELPFSRAFELIEEKYNNSDQWNEEDGYYGVGMREIASQDWQVGWVGGGMSSLPLLADGVERSRERAARTLDFVTGPGQQESGIFWGFHHKGEFTHSTDMWLRKHLERGGSRSDALGARIAANQGGHLVRKSADTVYFLAKQIALYRKRSREVPQRWLSSLRLAADAVRSLWVRHGQLGQFVQGSTLDITIGGTTSGAMAPGGLVVAAQVLGEESLVATAAEIATSYFEAFSRDGFTNGGPGDMLQNPDSESAYALLASLVVLWEETGDGAWLRRAEAVARYATTWTMTYDFPFPVDSTFGELGMRTTGSTFANTQNKHSSPGLCTLSGQSLFKLYRATGDARYLSIIAGMTHNITQYLSRDDRPIMAITEGKYQPSGWMNERVETSDWLEPVGEIFYGPCWCEVSCLLTYSEIPGIYVQPDTGLLQAFDHVQARIDGASDSLNVTNPTKFPARVKLLVEPSANMSRPLGENYLSEARMVGLQPGEETQIGLT